MTGATSGSSVLSALLSLASTQTQLTTYQKQLSSGLRVAMPSDDPIAWAAAQRLLAQATVLGATKGSLVEATSVTQIAAGALSNVLAILEKMKSDVISAQQSETNVGAA